MTRAGRAGGPLPSPLRLFLTVLAIVFVAEGVVMLLLPVLLGGGHEEIEPVVDAALLIGLSAPFLWWSVVRPLRSAALAEHARAATVIAHARDGIITINEAGNVQSFNSAAERIFGYEAREVLGRPATILLPDRYREAHQRGVEGARTPGASRPRGKALEVHGRRRDGGTFPMELSLATWSVRGETFHTAILRDITERKQAEEALQARTTQLEAVRAVAAEITRELDLNKLLELITQRAAELLRVTSGGVLLWDERTQRLSPRRWRGPGDCGGEIRLALGEGVTGTVAQRRQGMIVHDYSASPHALPRLADRVGPSALVVQPLLYRDRLLGVIALSTLGTQRRFTGHDLEILHLLAAQAAVAIENARLYEESRTLATLQERERLAREMHDGLAQALAFLCLKLEQAQQNMTAGRTAHPVQDLQKMLAVAEGAYEELRQAIFGLRSMGNHRLGLVPTLTEYLREFGARNGIPVTLEAPEGQSPPIAPATEVQLVRIVQEALANVLKHAQASRAWVRIRWQNSCILVEIQDDGRGFDPGVPSSPDRRHFGLQTMRERAEGLGGTLAIETAPGRGTRIVATLPGGP